MSFRKGDYVVLHTTEEAKKYDGTIQQCDSDEFQCGQGEILYTAVKLKGLPGNYDVRYLPRVKINEFLKDMFRTNRVKPETVEMQEYILELLSKNKNGMYSKDILRKAREERGFYYSNITVLMKRIMQEHPEIKKPYNGFYIIDKGE